MDADAGVALTETDKEKSIDEAKPAEPLPVHIILPEDAVDPDDPYSENPASDLKYPTAGQHSLALTGHPEPAEA